MPQRNKPGKLWQIQHLVLPQKRSFYLTFVNTALSPVRLMKTGVPCLLAKKPTNQIFVFNTHETDPGFTLNHKYTLLCEILWLI